MSRPELSQAAGGSSVGTHERIDDQTSAFSSQGLVSCWAAWAARSDVRGRPKRAPLEVSKSEAEWRRQLTSEQFAVLREEDTERAWSSPLNNEHRPGLYRCAGCGLAVFSSETKFESGTGWPSFWAALEDSIRTKAEGIEFFYPRTEVHCRRCGGHFGHVFKDGPRPTGLRYCMNGVALSFEPASAVGSRAVSP